jgi:hypothetical protein
MPESRGLGDNATGQPLFDEPRLPRTDAPPMPMPAPVPLPLPPGASRSEHPRRKRTVALIVGGVLALLVLCAIVVAGLGSFVRSAFPNSVYAGGGSSGVLATRWADGGRYAVVEYQGSAQDSTTSVIVWDSQTDRTRKVDGFRLVAVEASSTQIWLTRAVADDLVLDPNIGADITPPTDSPWASPDYGGPMSDGPGAAWSWDLAGAGDPVPRSSPSWRPWIGPNGSTALLSVDPSIGLLPSSLSFSGDGAAPRKVAMPSDLGSFMPLGWSPSGRFFAVLGLDGQDGIPTWVGIVDSRASGVVASYTTDDWPGNVPDSASLDIDGAAWDPVADKVWVAQSSQSTSDNGDNATTTISAVAVAPGGANFPVVATPSAWASAQNPSIVLGTSATGVLIEIDTPDGPSVWNLGSGRPVRVGLSAAGAGYSLEEGGYSARSGMLAAIEPVMPFDNSGDGRAVILDPTGETIRTIWPT